MGLIYHYCSMDTFNIIMKNKTLRLSDITKSNDSQEKLLIYNHLKKAMTNAFKSVHLTIKPEDSDGVGSYLSTAKKDLDEVVHQKSLVVCFSKAEDLLSQWRGYANDGRGFSIGFDLELLKAYLKRDERFRICDIEYDEEKQIKMIESNIRNAFLDFAVRTNLQIVNVPGSVGIDIDFSLYQDLFYEEYDEICSDMARYFDFSSCMMKNGAFREEDEVRIIFAPEFDFCIENGYEVEAKIKGTTKLNLGKIDYQVKGDKLVPFVDMDFSKAIADGLIRKIIIGPKADVNEDELQNYLWYRGFENIEIKKSTASYV